MTRWIVGVALLAAGPAVADMRVEFREGAPKDRFVVTNLADCAVPAGNLTIDLTGSAGQLVFDVTGQGAGVEVFQPFEVVSGADFLAEVPEVIDGQTEVTLTFTGLAAGGQVVATTDLDDTIGAREITVRGSELDGAAVVLAVAGDERRVTFQDDSVATVPLTC